MVGKLGTVWRVGASKMTEGKVVVERSAPKKKKKNLGCLPFCCACSFSPYRLFRLGFR